MVDWRVFFVIPRWDKHTKLLSALQLPNIFLSSVGWGNSNENSKDVIKTSTFSLQSKPSTVNYNQLSALDDCRGYQDVEKSLFCWRRSTVALQLHEHTFHSYTYTQKAGRGQCLQSRWGNITDSSTNQAFFLVLSALFWLKAADKT